MLSILLAVYSTLAPSLCLNTFLCACLCLLAQSPSLCASQHACLCREDGLSLPLPCPPLLASAFPSASTAYCPQEGRRRRITPPCPHTCWWMRGQKEEEVGGYLEKRGSGRLPCLFRLLHPAIMPTCQLPACTSSCHYFLPHCQPHAGTFTLLPGLQPSPIPSCTGPPHALEEGTWTPQPPWPAGCCYPEESTSASPALVPLGGAQRRRVLHNALGSARAYMRLSLSPRGCCRVRLCLPALLPRRHIFAFLRCLAHALAHALRHMPPRCRQYVLQLTPVPLNILAASA